VTGIEDVHIGYTICDVDKPDALPPISVDEPTLVMSFQVNTSPLAGKEGKFVTSRQIRERLMRELGEQRGAARRRHRDADVFRVSGRGELHLTILIENMRREGYELAVGKPRVLTKTIDGVVHEPFEALTVDIDEGHQGGVMEALGRRKAEMKDMRTTAAAACASSTACPRAGSSASRASS
jgi:GTP-binding protein